MQVTDAPFGGASEIIGRDPAVGAGYEAVLRVLMSTSMPLRGVAKSRPRFIYDQTEFQRLIRAQLRSMGWTHGRALSTDFVYDGTKMSGVRADLMGFGCHAILEFGNRASWAHNLLTRGVGSVNGAGAQLLIYVAPVARLADQIDSNLATFERIAASLAWIEQRAPRCLPAPVSVIGVDVDLTSERGIRR